MENDRQPQPLNPTPLDPDQMFEALTEKIRAVGHPVDLERVRAA